MSAPCCMAAAHGQTCTCRVPLTASDVLLSDYAAQTDEIARLRAAIQSAEGWLRVGQIEEARAALKGSSQ